MRRTFVLGNVRGNVLANVRENVLTNGNVLGNVSENVLANVRENVLTNVCKSASKRSKERHEIDKSLRAKRLCKAEFWRIWRSIFLSDSWEFGDDDNRRTVFVRDDAESVDSLVTVPRIELWALKKVSG